MNIGHRRKEMSVIRMIEPWLVMAVLLFVIALVSAVWNSYMTGLAITEYFTPIVLLISAVLLSIGIAKQIKRLKT